MASWLVCSSPDQAVQVRALDGDTVLCSWPSHFTLTASLSGTGKLYARGQHYDRLTSHSGGK